MGRAISVGRKTVRPPIGCEGHLTRRQAAIQLGLRSEFKIRQFERDGHLHAVRGRMGTAFYSEAEVLALRAELGAAPRSAPGRWTDAELIALLRQPTTSGRLRTSVDLVTEAKVSIARAERVYRFWSRRDETLAAQATRAAGLRPRVTPAAGRAEGREPVGARAPAAQGWAASASSSAAAFANKVSANERRGTARLAHDKLVQSLRDADPRVRAEAFVKLKECQRP